MKVVAHGWVRVEREVRRRREMNCFFSFLSASFEGGFGSNKSSSGVGGGGSSGPGHPVTGVNVRQLGCA